MIDDEKIIEMFFERSEQGIRELDIKYGKFATIFPTISQSCGLILFLIILSEKLWTGKLLNKHKLFGHVYMIFLIPLTWTVFAVNDITQLGILFTRLFPFFGKGAWSVFRYDYLKYLGQYYLFFIAGIFLSTTLPYKLLKKVKSKVLLTAFLLIILGGSLYCMYRGFDDPFLYFRF